MRALFWQRIVGEELDETLWSGLSDRGVELDLEALVEQFPKDKPKTESSPGKDKGGDDDGDEDGDAEGGGDDNSSKKKKKPTQDDKNKKKAITNLLEPKVLQNVGIALAKFRLPTRDIKAAILAMDDQVRNKLKKKIEKFN
jgi:hypothetical protein